MMDDDAEPLGVGLPEGWIGGGPGPLAYLDVFRGEVTRNGTSVILAPAELRLLVYLAYGPKPASLERLKDDLWPHLDAVGRRNVLKVTVYRLRVKLDAPDTVLWARKGYRLGAVAAPNLDQIEQTVRSLIGSAPSLEGASYEAVAALRGALHAGRPEFLLSCSWFETTERRLTDLSYEATLVLARHALSNGDCARALTLTRELIEVDPFDEEARELRLAALRRCNKGSRARTEFENYERTIRD